MPFRLTSSTFLLNYSLLWSLAHAQVAPSVLSPRDPSSGDAEAPLSATASRDRSYLPIQIGGILGAYAVSLVLVAITLLALRKKRREKIHAANNEIDFLDEPKFAQYPLTTLSHTVKDDPVTSIEEYQKPVVPNFSYPSPTKTEFSIPPFNPTSTVRSSTHSSFSAPGTSPLVDQSVVIADQIMAQAQLEEMYRHVMEHEDAKQRGVALDPPTYGVSSQRGSVSEKSIKSTSSKKERSKPASLNLNNSNVEVKKGPKTPSFFSALKSPKRKGPKGISISSPIMTPKSGTFPRDDVPRHDVDDNVTNLGALSPRYYTNPLAPPPIPRDSQYPRGVTAIQPELPVDSSQSIDERMGFRSVNYARSSMARSSMARSEIDPESAISEHSQTPLVGLPSSPRRPSGRFPSLPQSPKPGVSFSRNNAPSAVRTGGSLPLRSYEPAMNSPTSQTTKQTVFERKGPLSPMGAKTPGTAVPYSPYQPFTPCMPMTPSLVTKEDRKRMRRLEPKTPTLEMVRSDDDVW